MWDHKGLLGHRPRWQRVLERVAEAIMVPVAFLLLCSAAGMFQP